MDLSELKGIINLMQKSDLSELEIELQDLKLRLARPGAAQPVYEQVIKHQIATNFRILLTVSEKATSSTSLTGNGIEIFKSPMVGTFYRKPSPDDPAFVEVGKKVKSWRCSLHC